MSGTLLSYRESQYYMLFKILKTIPWELLWKEIMNVWGSQQTMVYIRIRIFRLIKAIEPWVVKSFIRCDPLCRVVTEHALQTNITLPILHSVDLQLKDPSLSVSFWYYVVATSGIPCYRMVVLWHRATLPRLEFLMYYISPVLLHSTWRFERSYLFHFHLSKLHLLEA